MNGLREGHAPDGASLRLIWADPASLTENPAQWRIHLERQRAALEGVLAEVGWAGAALYNEATGHLVDGHLRRSLAVAAGDAIPVLVGRWTEEQERLLLATFDPIGAMAERDDGLLTDLLEQIRSADPDAGAIVDEVLGLLGIEQGATAFFDGAGDADAVKAPNLDVLLRGFHFALPPELAVEADAALASALGAVTDDCDSRLTRMSLAFLEICRGYVR